MSLLSDTISAFNDGYRLIAHKGGTRSGKTYSILTFLAALFVKSSVRYSIDIVSETTPHLKLGVLKDWSTILDNMHAEEGIDYEHNRTDHIYTSLRTGIEVRFFAVDQWGKAKGPGRDILFINEANRVPRETARQLMTRTRKTVIVDWNPDAEYWYEADGYDALPTTKQIHSTYRDNPFLSAGQIAAIEANKADAEWWRVYGEGLTGSYLGLIYPDFEQIDDLPDGGIDVYGMDFGFTHDPTVLLHARIDHGRRVISLDEVCYNTGMLNSDIVETMRREGIGRATPVYADCAEPKTIAELHRAGYNVLPCYKAVRKAEQLQAIKGYAIHVTKRSLNVIKELRNYSWAKDKDGQMLNEPIAVNDHAMDAMRYAVFKSISGRQSGKYNIKFV